METEIKWADVAHYYQFSEIKIRVYGYGDFPALRMEREGVYFQFNAFSPFESDHPLSAKHKPILRDAKTEAEETEIRRMETSEETIMRLKYGVMSPKVLAKHFEMGIDVFGLIKSGQAIRKSIG